MGEQDEHPVSQAFVLLKNGLLLDARMVTAFAPRSHLREAEF
jgi:hypothetical protein